MSPKPLEPAEGPIRPPWGCFGPIEASYEGRVEYIQKLMAFSVPWSGAPWWDIG
jgi:hypothetical protein